MHAIKEAQGKEEEGGEPDYASMTPEERKRAKVRKSLYVCGEGRGG